MNITAFVLGIVYAAAGLVLGICNMRGWLASGGATRRGRWPLLFASWQWAIIWACVLAIGLGLAAWAA